MGSKIQLTQQEKDILDKVVSHKVISVTELVDTLGLPYPAIYSAYVKFERFGLGKLVEKEVETYKLTKEGNEVLQKGLVEQRILSFIAEHPNPRMKDIMAQLDVDKKELNAGIGRLRKREAVAIVKGVLETNTANIGLVQEQVKILETTLKDVSEGCAQTSLSTEALEELQTRGLLEKEAVTVRHFEQGEAFTTLHEQVEVKERVSLLTPQMIKTGKWREVEFNPINLGARPGFVGLGRKQPYAQFLDELRRKLMALGFQEMRGPLVETEFWNFDSLFQAQDHPAREWTDVYFVNEPWKGRLPNEQYVQNVAKTHEDGGETGSRGWRTSWDPMKSAQLILRPQGTAVSARHLVGLKPPIKYFSIARCYRPDMVDATHLSEFNQVEGIVADPSVNFRDLLWILKTFAEQVAEAKGRVVFRPDYYPFTSPSVELDVVDDPVVGSIEFGGAGIFRQEVSKPFGVDVPVLAWGLGVDRLFMVKYGISDIRELMSAKLEWLRASKMV